MLSSLLLTIIRFESLTSIVLRIMFLYKRRQLEQEFIAYLCIDGNKYHQGVIPTLNTEHHHRRIAFETQPLQRVYLLR